MGTTSRKAVVLHNLKVSVENLIIPEDDKKSLTELLKAVSRSAENTNGIVKKLSVVLNLLQLRHKLR